MNADTDGPYSDFRMNDGQRYELYLRLEQRDKVDIAALKAMLPVA